MVCPTLQLSATSLLLLLAVCISEPIAGQGDVGSSPLSPGISAASAAPVATPAATAMPQPATPATVDLFTPLTVSAAGVSHVSGRNLPKDVEVAMIETSSG